MKILNNYLNGNVTVSIYDDGTKILEWDDNEIPQPIYPTSMDIKITNKCDLGCAFCHEMSVVDGKNADLDNLFNIIKTLPAGTELALGGGNPLEHNYLLPFLNECKLIKLIPSITINGKHLDKYINLINGLIDGKFIYGLGISINDDFDFNLLNKINNSSNVVFHLIAGVNRISILDKIKESKVKKVLILGYKEVGRGIKFYSDSVKENLSEWSSKIGNYIGKMHLSFDNLIIKQLSIKDFVSDEKWKSLYMGDDGQFTMYIDAVKSEFAVSSTSKERFPLEGSIEEIFSKVKSISKV